MFDQQTSAQRLRPVVLAAAAHPDDIEFMMAGTLLLLGARGAELHMFNLASGSCGSATFDRDEIVEIRLREARASARVAGATHHPPLVDDALILYNRDLLAQTAALIRQVRPEILLLPSPEDYMEDHQTTSRLLVTAAFVRGMKNFVTDPPLEPWLDSEVVLYHAQPYGLRDALRRLVRPGLYVDTATVLKTKQEMLACHRSQKEWLDVSQGIDSYLERMIEMSAEMGRMSGRFTHAEGWRRHSHFGFSTADLDPLSAVLHDLCWVDPGCEQGRL